MSNSQGVETLEALDALPAYTVIVIDEYRVAWQRLRNGGPWHSTTGQTSEAEDLVEEDFFATVIWSAA